MQKFRPFIIALFITLPFYSGSKIVEKVVAVVEGEMILQSEVNSFKDRIKKGYLVNESLLGLFDKKKILKNNDELINYLISKKLITVHAAKNNMPITEDVIKKELTNLASQNGISVDKLEKEIKNRGVDFSLYKSFIGESAVTRNLIEREVIARVRPSEEEFLSYLKKEGVSNLEPEYEFDLAQIFLPNEVKNGEQLLKKVNSNNFSSMQDRLIKLGADTDDLGKFKTQDMSPSILKATNGLSRGDVSKILSDTTGNRVIYVKDKLSSLKIPNTKKVQKLQQKFYAENIQIKFDNWLGELKNSYFIRKN